MLCLVCHIADFVYFCVAVNNDGNIKLIFFMVNQKLISAKIDNSLLEELDKLCDEYGIKRNRMLNALIVIGLDMLQNRRSLFLKLSALSRVSFDD